MPGKRRKRSTRKKVCSKGDLNRLTDAVIHPLYKKNQALRLLDGAVHAAIERNPKMSAKKFVKYNLPDLINEILKRL